MKNQRMIAIGLLLSAAGFLVAACGESIESENVETDGVWADFYATADGDGQTFMHAGLRTGGPNSNTFLTLGSGDELTFHADNQSYTPDANSAFRNYEVYEKNVPKDAGGTNLRIEFTRQDGTDAPNSSATLPGKFQITSPNSGNSYSRSSDDITVRISNSGASNVSHSLDLHAGECLENGYNTDFTGTTITIPHSELEKDDDDDAPDRCDVDLTVRRERSGSVDSNYSGGEFVAAQERTRTITSKP